MVQANTVATALRRTWLNYVEFHTRAPFKLRYIALIGLVGYPLYYIVWKSILPEGYESIYLRGAGMALCAAIYVKPWWPARMRPFFLLFAYVALMFCLPVFFTFMLLKNNGSPVWLMSTMAAFLFVILLYDISNAVIVTVLGTIIAIVAYFVTDGVQPLPISYVASLPIYMFALAAVVFLSYSERLIAKEKLLAANLLASNIAHEMRTPLLGIRLDCEQLRTDLSAVLEGNAWAQARGGPGLAPSRAEQSCLAVHRIDGHAVAANLVIDMLLANVAQQSGHGRGEAAVVSVRQVIVTALERYHFRPGERQRVSVSGDLDVTFRGVELMMVHVFFNLLKNALNAINSRLDGRIRITVRCVEPDVTIDVSDNGPGISPDLLPLIFMPFVTGGSHMQGTGIGLWFCRSVIEGAAGTISCASNAESGTTFRIRLPMALPGDAVDQAAATLGAREDLSSRAL